MKQAKVLTSTDTRKVLLYITAHKHSSRNRTMLLMTTDCGMRVGEVAALRICDVLNSDGTIKDLIRLSVEQTKGNHSRTVVLSQQMQQELHNYLTVRFK